MYTKWSLVAIAKLKNPQNLCLAVKQLRRMKKRRDNKILQKCSKSKSLQYR